jgi:hypothetical protein
MMNCKEFGRSSSGLILRFYSGICLDGLRKTRNTCQHNRSEDLNPGLSGYEGTEIFKKSVFLGKERHFSRNAGS